MRAALPLLLVLLLSPAAGAAPRGSVVSGRAVDEHGRPVGGATVRLLDWPYADGEAIVSARTDASGDFRLVYRDDVADLCPCKRSLRVRAGTAELEGEPRGVWLEPGEIALGDLVLYRAVIVRGRVVDEEGVPVPRTLVTLRDEIPYWDEHEVLTDEDGGFGFPVLPGRPRPGCVLSAVRPGYVPDERRIPELSAFRPEPIVLRRGRVVRGRMVFCDGTPAGQVSGTAGRRYGDVPFETDDAGNFEAVGLPAAQARLWTRSSPAGPGGRRFFNRWLTIPDGPAGEAVDLGEIRLTLVPDEPAGLLRGRVLDEEGRPCEALSVRADLLGGPSVHAFGFVERDGSFSIETPFVGLYRVSAFRDLDAGYAQRVQGGPVGHFGDGIELRFPGDGLLVLRLRGEAPPEGLELLVDGDLRAQVFDAGRPLRLRPGPGRHTIRLEHFRETAAEVRDLEVSEEGLTECELRLRAR